MKFSSWCEMNLRKWPMDTQVCELKFGSWTHSGLEILLGFYQNDPNGPRVSSTSKKLIYTLLQILLEILKTYLNLKHFANFQVELDYYKQFSNEWKIIATSGRHNIKKYDCCPESYHDITFELTLKRSAEAYKSIILMPAFSNN